MVLAVIVPIVIIVSLLLLAIVVRFITYHKVDLRKVIPILVPGVAIESRNGKKYWCIAGRFYYFMDIKRTRYDQSKQPEKNEFELAQKNSESFNNESSGDVDVELSNSNPPDINGPSISAIDASNNDRPDKLSKTEPSMKRVYQESRATWLLYGMLAIVFIISCAYFVNKTVVYERTIRACSKLTNDELHRSHCYSDLFDSYSSVNCNLNETETFSSTLYCYIVLDIIEANPIDEVIESIVFFYITGVAISVIFHVVKFLLNFYLTKLWSLLVIVMGTVLLLMLLSVFILIFLTGTHIDILLLFKAISISIDFILAGVLLLKSIPLEEQEI